MKTISTPSLIIIIAAVAFTSGFSLSTRKFQRLHEANLDALSTIAVYTGGQIALADHSLNYLRDGNHSDLTEDLELIMDDAVVYLENLRSQVGRKDTRDYIDGVHLAALDYRLDHPWEVARYSIPPLGGVPVIQHAKDLTQVRNVYRVVAERNGLSVAD